MALVRDENDARELVQDAFLRVYKNIGTFQGQSSFFTWLYRIITNLSIDLIRKPGRQIAELDESKASTDSEEGPSKDFPFLSRIDGADPADVVRRGEIALRLREALAALPPPPPRLPPAALILDERAVEGLELTRRWQAQFSP